MSMHVIPIAVALLSVAVVTVMMSPTRVVDPPKDDDSLPMSVATAAQTQLLADKNSSSIAATMTSSFSSSSSKDTSKLAKANWLLSKSESPRSVRKARTVLSSYQYPVVRQGRCATNNEYYGHCYLCGRMADVPRIYYECCLEIDTVRAFCDEMLF